MVKLKTITSRALLGAIHLAKLLMLPDNSTSPAVGHGGINVLATTSGTCEIDEVVCGNGCMPILGVCCGTRGYCDLGEYCTIGDGCCPEGKVCSSSGSCDAGKTLCNGGCMPSTGVCCSDGGYCDAGETCSTQRTCARGSSSGGSSGGGGGSGGSGGGSSFPTFSFSPVPTANPAGNANGNSNGNGDSTKSGPGNFGPVRPASGANSLAVSVGCVFAAGLVGSVALFL